jgi:hypothetical protein
MYSQDTSAIDPQRPTLTESNSLVSKGRVQFENGATRDLSNGTTSYGTFIRFGAHDKIEPRMTANFRSNDINLGVKFHLFTLEPVLRLKSSLIYDFSISGMYVYKLASTINFNECLYMNHNIAYDGDFYNIVLLGYIEGKNGVFAEYSNQLSNTLFHAGVTRRLSNSAQFDINGGYLVESKAGYIGIGFSFYAK